MSSSSWHRQDESTYLLDEPSSNPFSPPDGLDGMEAQALLSSDEDDEALSLPSAGVANVRGETPEEDSDDDVDIGEFDWGQADKEVNDFLAELGEDSAMETDNSDNERYSSYIWLTQVSHQKSQQADGHRINANGNERGSRRGSLQIPKTQMEM